MLTLYVNGHCYEIDNMATVGDFINAINMSFFEHIVMFDDVEEDTLLADLGICNEMRLTTTKYPLKYLQITYFDPVEQFLEQYELGNEYLELSIKIDGYDIVTINGDRSTIGELFTFVPPSSFMLNMDTYYYVNAASLKSSSIGTHERDYGYVTLEHDIKFIGCEEGNSFFYIAPKKPRVGFVENIKQEGPKQILKVIDGKSGLYEINSDGEVDNIDSFDITGNKNITIILARNYLYGDKNIFNKFKSMQYYSEENYSLIHVDDWFDVLIEWQ